MSYLLSFCVPTYNRSSEIINLINSIEPFIQKNNCELVICDDGSTDDTQKVIKEIIKKKKINIKYKYIDHSGRPRAVREAVFMSNSDYIIITGDDDYFDKKNLLSALDLINKNQKKLSDQYFGGFNFLCKNMDGNEIIGDKFPLSNNEYNLLNLRYVDGIKGDKCEVYKSQILKKYIYDLIKDEIRIPTIYIQARINKYNFLCYNIPIKVVNYRKDGMSNNLLKYKLNSPNYTYLTYLELYKIKFTNVKIYKYFSLLVNYWRFYLHADKKNRKNVKKNLFIDFVTFIVGFLFFLKDKIYLNISNENRKS